MKNDKLAGILHHLMEECYEKSKEEYYLPYHGETFSVYLTVEILEQYIQYTIILVRRILLLQRVGKLTKEKLEEFKKEIQKEGAKSEEEFLFWVVMKGFSKGGILYDEVFSEVVCGIGVLQEIPLGTAAWFLMRKPSLNSAIYAVIESSIGRMEDEKVYITAAWYFLRAVLLISLDRKSGE